MESTIEKGSKEIEKPTEIPLAIKRKQTVLSDDQEPEIDKEIEAIQANDASTVQAAPVVPQSQTKKLKVSVNKSVSAPEVSLHPTPKEGTLMTSQVESNVPDQIENYAKKLRSRGPALPSSQAEQTNLDVDAQEEGDDGDNDGWEDQEEDYDIGVDEDGTAADIESYLQPASDRAIEREYDEDEESEEGEEEADGEGAPNAQAQVDAVPGAIEGEAQVVHVRHMFYNELISVLETFDDKDINPQWTEDTLCRWLRAFELFWNPKSLEPNDLFEMLKVNFGLTSFESVDPNYIQELADKKAFYPLINLQMRFTAMGFIMNSAFPKSEEYTDRFFKLMTDVCELCEMMFHYVGYVWMKKHNYTSPTDAKIGMFQWSPKYDQASLNTYQKSLIFCFFQLKKKSYRRCGDMIYAPIYNHKHQFTFAYKPIKTIKEFVYNSADLLSQHNNFLNMTEARNNNPTSIIQFLKEHQCAFLPEIKPTRYLFAWNNGLFNLLDFSFKTFDETEKENKATRQTLDSLQEFENASHLRRQEILKSMMDRERQLRKKAVKEKQVFKPVFLPESEIQEPLEGEVVLTEQEKIDLEISKWNDAAVAPFTNPYTIACPLKFIGQDFEDYTKETDYNKIPTPFFSSIPNNQGWGDKTKRFYYGFYGRCFFGLGDYKQEQWQACPILMGISDSAKSTSLHPIQQLIPGEFLGLINTRVEKKFGLQNLLNYGRNLTIIGLEVGADCELCVDDLKSIITGELVKINIKNDQSVDVVVRCPMIFACNALPRMWRNDGFSLEKRCMIFHFSKKIPQSLMMTDYKKFLTQELSKILQKTVLAYRGMVDEFGNKNIWLETPPEIIEKVKMFLSENDPLKAFINDPTYCEQDPTKWVSEEVFRAAFSAYCDSRKIRMPSWKNPYIEPILSSKQMKIIREQKCTNGKYSYENWIEGVRLVERPDYRPQNQQAPTNRILTHQDEDDMPVNTDSHRANALANGGQFLSGLADSSKQKKVSDPRSRPTFLPL